MTKKEFKPELIEYIGPAGAGKTTLATKQIKKLRAEGKRVLTFEYYKKHRLILIWDLLKFPFFIIKKRKQIKDIWRLFKKDIKLKTKIKHTITTTFIMYKTLNLIRRAKKKNINKVILDQGFVQKITSFLFKERERIELKKHLTYYLATKSKLNIVFIYSDFEKIWFRRKKRKNKNDLKMVKIRLSKKNKATIERKLFFLNQIRNEISIEKIKT